jgi:hypothetical protein
VTVNDQLSKGEFVDKNAKKPRKVAEFLWVPEPHRQRTRKQLRYPCARALARLCSASWNPMRNQWMQVLLRVMQVRIKKEFCWELFKGSVITTLTILVAAGAGAYYTFVNCCNLDWCRSFALSNPALNDILHCWNT